jgi:hypothetical protein
MQASTIVSDPSLFGMQACCWKLHAVLAKALQLTGQELNNRSWVVQKHPVCGCWLSHYLENVDLKEDPYCPGCKNSNSRWHSKAYKAVKQLVASKYPGLVFLPELPLLQLPGNLRYADLVIAPPAGAAHGHLLAVELDSEVHDTKPIKKKGEDIVDAWMRVSEQDDAKDKLYRKLGWGVYRLKWDKVQKNGWIEEEAVKALDLELQKVAGPCMR